MVSINQLQPGEKVQVIDPDDGYYLQEGEVEEVRGKVVYVRFAPDDEGQPFRPAQLRRVPEEE
jgi:hypothetical protein